MDNFDINFPEEEKKEINTEEKIEIFKNPHEKRKKFFIFAILAVLSLLALNTIYSNFFQKDITEKNGINESTVIPDPPTSNNAEENSNINNDNNSNNIIPEIIPEKLILTISIMDLSKGRESCWVQVFADGKQVFEGTMYEKDREVFEGKETIKAVFGNAGVVNLTLGDENLGTPGKIKEVVEKVFNIKDI